MMWIAKGWALGDVDHQGYPVKVIIGLDMGRLDMDMDVDVDMDMDMDVDMGLVFGGAWRTDGFHGVKRS